ncbi:MAG: hypothetical protein ABI354_02525 [Candidatus Saccharimonadales bacterium]
MIIIGMTGPIGHGKTTFSDALAELEPTTVHLESSQVIIEVANAWQAALSGVPDPYNVEGLNNWLRALPSILLEITRVKCSFEQIALSQNSIEEHPIEFQKLILHAENLQRNPTLISENITVDNKESYRPLLQWLGGYLVQKADSGIWYREILRRALHASTKGCKLCLVGGLRYPSDAAILREASAIIIKIHRPGHLQSDLLDPTERERQNIKADCEVRSNGTVADVKNFAKLFYIDLCNNDLKSTYQTASM